MKRAVLTFLCLAAASCVCAPSAGAWWTSTGTGSAAAQVATMPAGPTPSASVSGTTVTVSFSQVQLLAANVGAYTGGGYMVLRYPAAGGAAVTPGGTCGALVSGTASSLTCTETSTPEGSWKYTVTPVLLTWTGAESAQSSAVTVTAPLSVVATDPGRYVGGTVALGGTATGIPGGLASLTLERRQVGGTTWTTVCSGSASPLSCSLNTSSFSDGYSFELRLTAVSTTSTTYTSAIVTPITVDNTTPYWAQINGLASNLSGSVVLSGTGGDGGPSGLAHETFQYSVAGAGSWQTACTANSGSPFSCTFDTTVASDGLYDFRVIAYDGAGNSVTSGTVTNRRIDNTAPTLTLNAIPDYMKAGLTLSGTIADGGSGGSSPVTIQIRTSPSGAWTTACTAYGTPNFSCYFNSSSLADGSYDFRAVGSDVAGNSGSSAVVAARTVDNTAPVRTDIDMTNGGGTVGRIDAGDQVVLSFSEPVLASSILSGWDGSATAVRLLVHDWGSDDAANIYSADGSTNLPFGNLLTGGDFVGADSTFNATMQISGNDVVVTVGSTISASLKTVGGNSLAHWSAFGSITDLAGNTATGSPDESGPADPNF